MGINANTLNRARQQLLDNIVEYFLGKKGVEALYIQGSVASASADEYSDIDFRVVVQPHLYRHFLAERFTAPQQWGIGYITSGLAMIGFVSLTSSPLQN